MMGPTTGKAASGKALQIKNESKQILHPWLSTDDAGFSAPVSTRHAWHQSGVGSGIGIRMNSDSNDQDFRVYQDNG